MKVCIFGGEAIGGYVAAHLADSSQWSETATAPGRTLTTIPQSWYRTGRPNHRMSMLRHFDAGPTTRGRRASIVMRLRELRRREANIQDRRDS